MYCLQCSTRPTSGTITSSGKGTAPPWSHRALPCFHRSACRPGLLIALHVAGQRALRALYGGGAPPLAKCRQLAQVPASLPTFPLRSWLPTNETEGVCQMTNSADLPEAFLLVGATGGTPPSPGLSCCPDRCLAPPAQRPQRG